jgi:RNA polymerase sigma-70 factor (ECF subfamily)
LKPVLAHGHHFEMNFDLETLYEAKAAELILYGRALGLTHGEAEDVLQETFLALLKMAGGGTTCQDAPGKMPLEPEHYCVRSFRNRALNHRRSLWRRLTRELEVFADGHHWFEKSPDEIEQSMQTAAVDCLAALPVEQREAIVLKIWHRFTFEEIGGLLGISPNTAAGRYRYGLQKIKKRLEMPSPTKNYSLSPPGRGEGQGEGILFSPPPHEPQDRLFDYQRLAHLEVAGVQSAKKVSENSHPGQKIGSEPHDPHPACGHLLPRFAAERENLADVMEFFEATT